MSILESTIDRHGATFAKNREDMLAEIAGLRALESKARREEEAKRERYEGRGQILP
ncbi:MAG: acyl-CoA carboxylase subunit beta, partial [Proteobacteria bacterium]